MATSAVYNGIRLLQPWRGFEIGATPAVEAGVADVLVQKKVAEYVDQPNESDNGGDASDVATSFNLPSSTADSFGGRRHKQRR
jgi:hypothetical protein